MAIRDALAPIIQLLLFILYGIYIFLGLVLMIAGIYYVSSIEGANTFAAVVCIMCGFFMLIVGALAIFGNLKKNALIFAVVLLIDVALFVLLLSAMMVGMAIVNEVEDPVAKAVSEAYCDNPRESLNDYCKKRAGVYDIDNPGIMLRQSGWDGVVQLFDNGAPASCKAFDQSIRVQSKALTASQETCSGWSEYDQTIMVDNVDETCIAEPGCSDDEAANPTVCTHVDNSDKPATESTCEKTAAMPGTCVLTENIVGVAYNSGCPTGCFFHTADQYQSAVPDTCVPTAATGTAAGAALNPTYRTEPNEISGKPAALFSEVDVIDVCVQKSTAREVQHKAEHCVTTKAWDADVDQDNRVPGSQRPSEWDKDKECHTPTTCVMSQAADLAAAAPAVPASCGMVPGWGAATCTNVAAGSGDDCAGLVEADCIGLATWVTSDDTTAPAAGCADGLIAGDTDDAAATTTCSKAACTYKPAMAAADLPTCANPTEATPQLQFAACNANAGCVYTAAMAAAVADTAGACIALQGGDPAATTPKSCAYVATVAAEPATTCIIGTAAAAAVTAADASCSTGCTLNSAGTGCDIDAIGCMGIELQCRLFRGRLHCTPFPAPRHRHGSKMEIT